MEEGVVAGDVYLITKNSFMEQRDFEFNKDTNHHKLETFKKDVLNITLPCASLGWASMISGENSPASSFDGELSNENIFKESKYEYKGANKFLHFTNIAGLLGILENGHFRMSSVKDLEEKEISFAAKSTCTENKLFEIRDFNLDEIKKNIYTFSACESKNETLISTHMWEKYGDKNRGVAIEFEYENLDWFRHIIGEIQYGNAGLTPFRELTENYLSFFSTNQYNVTDFHKLMIELEAFHKDEEFRDENEIRLMLKKKRYDSRIFYDVRNHRYESIQYAKLFLTEKYPTDLIHIIDKTKFYPSVKICSVYLGSKIKYEVLFDIVKELECHKITDGYSFKLCKLNEKMEIVERQCNI